MRYILPAVAAAAVLSLGPAPVDAKAPQRPNDQRPRHARSHVSLHLTSHAVLGGKGLAAHGRARPGGRRAVKLVVRGAASVVLWTRTRANGTFAVRWSPPRPGNYRVRAYAAHDARRRAAASLGRRLTAYRLAGASYYGPGLYGSGVACGGTLQPQTMGVAHKSLPCGTLVKLRYNGRTTTVPVIDRGPYVAGRDYDLTEAVKAKLGFPGVGTVQANR
ncbi:MAG TPA: septal ring lytic transglycosylase RlpA family protein [Solirubrobacterales bacterium]|nr:septal ring lytic transglycosylase RlpA family protein [Solirubrobacterales bacterium]